MFSRAIASTILALLISAGHLCSQTILAEKIIFNSDMNGDHDIWMVNPDGTELEVLIDRPGNQTFPRISPDGTKIAFLDKPEPSSSMRSIVIRDLATGADTVLNTGFSGIPSTFSWRGDNSGVIARNEGPNCTGDPLAFIPLSGGNIPLFAENGRRLTVMAVDGLRDVLYYTSDPCWSPNTEVKQYNFADEQRSLVQAADGRLEGHGDIYGDDFVFYKATSGYSNAKIHLMAVDGTGERALSSGAGLIDANPRFSPDARQVVFFRREAGSDIDIYTVDVSTSVETPLVLDPFNSASPDWGHILLGCGGGNVCDCPCVSQNSLFADFVNGQVPIQEVLDCRDVSDHTGILVLRTDGTTAGAASGTKKGPAMCGTQVLGGEPIFIPVTLEEDTACRALLRAACPI